MRSTYCVLPGRRCLVSTTPGQPHPLPLSPGPAQAVPARRRSLPRISPVLPVRVPLICTQSRPSDVVVRVPRTLDRRRSGSGRLPGCSAGAPHHRSTLRRRLWKSRTLAHGTLGSSRHVGTAAFPAGFASGGSRPTDGVLALVGAPAEGARGRRGCWMLPPVPIWVLPGCWWSSMAAIHIVVGHAVWASDRPVRGLIRRVDHVHRLPCTTLWTVPLLRITHVMITLLRTTHSSELVQRSADPVDQRLLPGSLDALWTQSLLQDFFILSYLIFHILYLRKCTFTTRRREFELSAGHFMSSLSSVSSLGGVFTLCGQERHE